MKERAPLKISKPEDRKAMINRVAAGEDIYEVCDDMGFSRGWGGQVLSRFREGMTGEGVRQALVAGFIKPEEVILKIEDEFKRSGRADGCEEGDISNKALQHQYQRLAKRMEAVEDFLTGHGFTKQS